MWKWSIIGLIILTLIACCFLFREPPYTKDLGLAYCKKALAEVPDPTIYKHCSVSIDKPNFGSNFHVILNK